MKMYPLIILLIITAACHGKKDKKEETPAATQTTPPAETVAPPSSTTTTPAPSTPAPSNTSWQINKENCAARGLGFDPEKTRCLRLASKEACDALGNGSKFELRFGLGECVGPALQANTANCAAYGEKFDQALNTCQPINTKADCDALANASVFDTGFERCIGPRYRPSTDNCAAYGSKYDSANGTCVRIETEAECTALNSGAIFDAGYKECLGRCEYRSSILDDCFLD